MLLAMEIYSSGLRGDAHQSRPRSSVESGLDRTRGIVSIADEPQRSPRVPIAKPRKAIAVESGQGGAWRTFDSVMTHHRALSQKALPPARAFWAALASSGPMAGRERCTGSPSPRSARNDIVREVIPCRMGLGSTMSNPARPGGRWSCACMWRCRCRCPGRGRCRCPCRCRCEKNRSVLGLRQPTHDL